MKEKVYNITLKGQHLMTLIVDKKEDLDIELKILSQLYGVQKRTIKVEKV